MTAIDDKYASLPNAASFLGAPTGAEGAALDGGAFRHYQFGSIYYLPALGAFEVHGAIHAEWQAMGWERGLLGYPTTDETGTPDGVGRFNHFQNGSIYWTPATGAHEVHGPIHDVWSVTDWESGIGYPTTDVITVPDFADIEVSWFTRGIIANPALSPAEPFYVTSRGALLVVAPNNDFVSVAEPFIAHKRASGMPTFLHVLGTDELAVTEDAPLRLKGYIAEAATWLGVRYVLLLGDASLIPTQHRCTTPTPGGDMSASWYTPTDFYYADLYPGGVPVARPVGSSPQWLMPETWDANGNGKFDEHHFTNDVYSHNPDNVQAIPWVAVGRVPAHAPDQAAGYLQKVIQYETNEPTGTDKITVLTDHHYYSDNGNAYLAGTLLDIADIPREAAYSIGLDWPDGAATPDGLTPQAPWALRMTTAASRLLVYIGHGGPSEWAVDSDTYGAFDGASVATFTNASNWPIVMAAGCETSPIKANVPEEGMYLGIDNDAHSYSMTGTEVVGSSTQAPGRVPSGPAVNAPPAAAPIEPIRPSPLDFATSTSPGFAVDWLLHPAGGGIAYFGEAAVCPDFTGVNLLGRVIRNIGRGTVLGDAWIQGQTQYRQDFATSEDCQAAPRIYLTYMHLFGDPSLRLW